MIFHVVVSRLALNVEVTLSILLKSIIMCNVMNSVAGFGVDLRIKPFSSICKPRIYK
jgi:hypothetical protein